MKKTLPLLITCLFSMPTLAQLNGAEMTRDQFVSMYETMITQADTLNADKMMKDNLSAEDYQQYKAEEEAYQNELNKELAECVGVSEKKLATAKENLTPETTLKFVKQCSSSLPDTIKISGLDFTKEASLNDFNQCVQGKISSASNISLEKFQQCQRELGEGDYFEDDELEDGFE